MLGKYKNLWGDLAYRTDMASEGSVSSDWLEVFKRFPDRFMLGTDTFTLERLHYIGEHANFSRGWLKGLPAQLAERIGYKNGEALLAQVWKHDDAKRQP